MNNLISKPVYCKSCQQDTRASLFRFVMQSGAHTYAWYCDNCHRVNPEGSKTLWIPKEKVITYLIGKNLDPEDLPVRMPDCVIRCVVCGKRGAEEHHWAPKALFGDKAGDWPKDYLCKTCHDLWHQTVTPQLVRS